MNELKILNLFPLPCTIYIAFFIFATLLCSVVNSIALLQKQYNRLFTLHNIIERSYKAERTR